MLLDASEVPSGTIIETEVAIVGGGAAGITLAREFAQSGFRVALLEGGGMEIEAETQELYAGSDIGRSYLDLTSCRLRFFGGTTNHWGGWCLPFDPVDFEAHEGVPYSGWPFDRVYLDPWYKRAHVLCELGTYEYEPSRWGINTAKILAPFGGPHFVAKIIQQSPPTRFGTRYEAELRSAQRVSVYLNANVLRFDTDDANQQVTSARVATLAGNRMTVRAKFFVLATGGIENARMLLLSGTAGGNGLGNERDLVGRHFAVHLVYPGGTIVPSDRYADYGAFTGRGDVAYNGPEVSGRYVSLVGLSEDTRRRMALPGTHMNWSYQFAPTVDAIKALKRLLKSDGKSTDTWGDLQMVLRDIDGVAEFAVRKALYDQGVPVLALSVGCSAGQLSNPDSRIRLADDLDPFGMRRVAVDWQITAEDKRKAVAIQRLLAAEVGRVGMGRLKPAVTGEDDTTWPKEMYGDAHHTGTTRMHRDPARGVVDPDCRVHGMANLYVAGSSVFPNCGSANSTLTIVALALRLADHLKEKLA